MILLFTLLIAAANNLKLDGTYFGAGLLDAMIIIGFFNYIGV